MHQQMSDQKRGGVGYRKEIVTVTAEAKLLV